MTARFKLPKDLQHRRLLLETALAKPLLGEWPKDGEKDSPFEDAPQPEAIGRVLIDELHDHLKTAHIAYVFKKDMKAKGRTKLGTAKRAGGELHWFTDHDFVISLNWTTWRLLEPLQRIALMDHELCHCVQDEEGMAWGMQDHDVKEFGVIVRRYGLWTPDLTRFAKDVEKAAQLGLFDEAPAEEQLAGAGAER